MKKNVNPTMIGAFVVGALVLLAGGTALFGGAELFAKRDVYVAYFEEPTNGLRVGANVLANGVRVGYVSDIALLVDQQSFAPTTRVTLEILPDTYIQTRGGIPIGEGLKNDVTYEELIHEGGMRARLEIESFVTGQLLIELVRRPDTEAVMRGADDRYQEIPTISSNIAQFLADVKRWFSEFEGQFDFSTIGGRVDSILTGLDELANSADLRTSLTGMSRLVNDDATQTLAGSLQQTLEDLREATAEASRLFRNADAHLDSIANDVAPALAQLEGALREAESALSAAKTQLRGNTPQAQQLESTLREVERAARSLNQFFDYLERNPEALLRGKQP